MRVSAFSASVLRVIKSTTLNRRGAGAEGAGAGFGAAGRSSSTTFSLGRGALVRSTFSSGTTCAPVPFVSVSRTHVLAMTINLAPALWTAPLPFPLAPERARFVGSRSASMHRGERMSSIPPDMEPITPAGLAALEAELTELETTGRRAMAERILSARELGDLSENAEYHIAKEDQAHLETRIARLRQHRDMR